MTHPHTLFYQPGIQDGHFHLDADESRHCLKVLRRKKGDHISLTDGKGYFYEGVITDPDPGRCSFSVVAKDEAPKRNFFIHIAISPTKNADRIEWFVEKATEFGVDQITLVECKNTERTHIKPERLRRVAISALKQSWKAALPTIADSLLPFGDLVSNCRETEKYIAVVDHANPLHLKDAAKEGTSYCVLIGPEGDFAPGELQAALERSFRKVSLGPARLRTETAGVAACHILNLVNS